MSHQKPRGTVSWASEGSRYVSLRQIFLRESNESLSHIFGPEKFTCVADGGSNVLKLDNSVVSDCGNAQLQGGDKYTWAMYSVREIPSKRSLARPDCVVSGTQPGELFHCGRSGCVDPDDRRFWDRRRSPPRASRRWVPT